MGQPELPAHRPFSQLPSLYAASKHPALPSLWNLLQPSSGKLYIMKEIPCFSHCALQQQLARLHPRPQLQHDNYLRGVQLFVQAKTGYCSESFRVGAVYQSAELTLYQELNSRLKEKKPFEQKQLWSILCSCVHALYHLQRHGVSSRIITPQTVFITEFGQVKVSDEVVAEAVASRGFYLRQWGTNTQPTREQQLVFGLGLTLLESACLEHCFDCLGSEDSPALSRRLESLRSSYSEDFIGTLAAMTSRCPPSLARLNSRLQELGTAMAGSSVNISFTEKDLDQGKDTCNEESHPASGAASQAVSPREGFDLKNRLLQEYATVRDEAQSFRTLLAKQRLKNQARQQQTFKMVAFPQESGFDSKTQQSIEISNCPNQQNWGRSQDLLKRLYPSEQWSQGEHCQEKGGLASQQLRKLAVREVRSPLACQPVPRQAFANS